MPEVQRQRRTVQLKKDCIRFLQLLNRYFSFCPIPQMIRVTCTARGTRRQRTLPVLSLQFLSKSSEGITPLPISSEMIRMSGFLRSSRRAVSAGSVPAWIILRT